jgi:hypothetical protein
MSTHFFMGAINKTTHKYENPKIANKINKYKCPFCEKDVIFKNGKIKQAHFSHYNKSTCSYYKKPNETQIHKDAKLLMKSLLDNKCSIKIYRKCYYCYEKPEEFLNITCEEYNNYNAIIEYKFNYNNSNRSADVALLKNMEIKYIFEICYTNKTKEENRPEPWFEIKAETLINDTNSGKNLNEKGEIEIECIRDYKCVCCKRKQEYEINKREEYEIRKRQEYEINKRNDLLKEKEEISEKNELLNMRNQDERTIQIEKALELKKEKERIEREIIIIKQTEQLEREKEFMRIFLEKDKKCNVCNINYCKCNNPNFIKNKYNKTICNFCIKYKCICVKITNYFKK